MPFARFPPGWQDRAKDLVIAHRRTADQHPPSRRRFRPGAPHPRLLDMVERHTIGDNLSDGDRGYARLALGRYLTKRGTPDSSRCCELRARQRLQCAGPPNTEFAAILADRLDGLPPAEGILDVSVITKPVTAAEETDRIPAATPIRCCAS